ncbi:hypothetical protein [Paraferrimonas sp. SM1919]|uniref:hypothetical protein n=1 Tax=Paraferrimonas sp. SM1919 TaxID=2662263 RepID=UPI0013D45914|nr:hypothetical protein [Paraferrimonas sp. SM1919]
MTVIAGTNIYTSTWAMSYQKPPHINVAVSITIHFNATVLSSTTQKMNNQCSTSPIYLLDILTVM